MKRAVENYGELWRTEQKRTELKRSIIRARKPGANQEQTRSIKRNVIETVLSSLMPFQ